eukprot:CAMPEP_0114548258 /NCGR_PEP_ID=MMETSP0114-20121206/4886_1 /TAXON_ID=31324 /ORGANISM="Goniomonas sp, Strain m" /LENGTH=678 /DNA_ID=CAMNT_0001732837 /DNA_START=15 /DNA_END=2048 /DNA_ORIENTATION=-
MKIPNFHAGLYIVDPGFDGLVDHTFPSLPLQSVDVEAKLVDTAAEVTITQTFVSQGATPVETIFAFPLDEGAAVCGFEAQVGTRTIVGLVKEKFEAEAEYHAAIRQGKTASLLSEVKADVFQLSLGNVPPQLTVRVRTTYVTELKAEGDATRFLLPTTVAPRYTPAGVSGVPSGPSAVAGGNWGLKLSLEVEMRSPIVSVTSPSHDVVSVTGDSSATATVTLSEGRAILDKDLTILIHTADPHQPRVCVEEDGSTGGRAAMLTLCPNIELDDARCEIVFVVDRSGSMAGSQIAQARSALQLFLRSLPADCYFNIIGFGSRHETLFPRSTQYSPQTLNTATQHVAHMQANLGGTELLRPLQTIASMRSIPGYSRQVFVLTDGQVSNTEQVFAQVKSMSSTARVFSLGIGGGVSHHLVEGMARAGRGNAQFVAADERLETKVIRQLKDALQPALVDVSIDWGVPPLPAPAASAPKSLLGYRKPDPRSLLRVTQAPHTLPPVFSGTRFTAFALLAPDAPLPREVTVTAQSPDGPLVVTLPVEAAEVYHGDVVHRLAARTLIRDLEEGASHLHRAGARMPTDSEVKAEVVRLGVAFNLASKHTSFVAVDPAAPVAPPRPVYHILRPQSAPAQCRSRFAPGALAVSQCSSSPPMTSRRSLASVPAAACFGAGGARDSRGGGNP